MAAPLHPYTRALLKAVPEPHPDGSLLADALAAAAEALQTAGTEAPAGPPAGCPYEPRCPIRISRCLTEEPPLEVVSGAHEAACYRAGLPEPPADAGLTPGADMTPNSLP
jgi:oligopeptide/dipeptide ABC transporter ATP-binding protein